MATYEIETDDGSIYQIETEEPITQQAKSASGGFMSPVVSQESILSNPISKGLSGAMPFTAMSGFPIPAPIGNMLPPNIKSPLNAQYISEQTSPAQILANMAVGLGGLGQAGKLPQIMNKGWRSAIPKETTRIVDETIGNYRDAYKQTLNPHFNKVVTVKDDLVELLGKNPKLGKIWNTRDEILKTISKGSWDKSEFFQRLKIGEENAIKMAGKLKDLVLKNLPEQARETVQSLDPAYSEAIKLGGFIKKKAFDPKSGTYKFKQLASVFRDKENSTSVEAFERFSELNPEMKQVTRDLQKYAGRQSLKKVGGIAAGGGAAAYLFHKWLSEQLLGKQY